MSQRHPSHQQALQEISPISTLCLSAVVGAVAGLLAVLFRWLVEWTDTHRLAWIKAVSDQHGMMGGVLVVAVTGVLGGLAAWSTRRYYPEAAGSGIPHVRAVLVSARTLAPLRLVATKVGAGLLAIASGMSLGREGPTIHIGSACGEGLARWVKLPNRTRQALIAAGAGAGLAAAFDAPLAGFLFIMEELRRDLSRKTYGNALVTAVAAVGVTRLCLGSDATYPSPDLSPLPLAAIPAIVTVGILAAPLGRLFNQAVLATSGRPGSALAKGITVGALGGLLALTFPTVTGGGNALISSLLSPTSSVSHDMSFLVLLLGLKFGFTVVSYATGVPGGIFAPMLCVGAILGYSTGLAFEQAIPWLAPEPQRLALIGMAAFLTASARAPLTGVVLIVEITDQYHTLFSLLLGSFVSYAISESVKTPPIYEALLERDLHGARERVGKEAVVLEVTVEAESAVLGSCTGHLHLPDDFLIAVVEREGEVLVPQGHTFLEPGDLLTLVIGPRCLPSSVEEFLETTRSR